MKIAIGILMTIVGSLSFAGELPAGNTMGKSLSNMTGKVGSYSFESKGRSGSHRVGGTGRSGKGGHYVGGRK